MSRRLAEREIGGAEEARLGDRAGAREAEVVEDRPGAELDRDAEADAPFAFDAGARVGRAGEGGIERGDGEREVLRRMLVGALVRRGRGELHKDATAGGRALVALAPEDEDGADLGVEVALVAIELLDVDGGAVVRIGDEGGVGVEVERGDAGAGGEGGAPRRGDRGVEAARVGVEEEIRAGELFFEVAVDLEADLGRRARAPFAELLHLVELEARVGAARDCDAPVL